MSCNERDLRDLWHFIVHNVKWFTNINNSEEDVKSKLIFLMQHLRVPNCIFNQVLVSRIGWCTLHLLDASYRRAIGPNDIRNLTDVLPPTSEDLFQSHVIWIVCALKKLLILSRVSTYWWLNLIVYKSMILKLPVIAIIFSIPQSKCPVFAYHFRCCLFNWHCIII